MYLWWNSYKHIQDTHTQVYRFVELYLEFPHLYRDQVVGKKHFYCESLAIIASTPYLTSHFVNNFTYVITHIFHGFAENRVINLNKFFSNSSFAKVLKFVLSSMYSRSRKLHDTIAVYDGSL